MLSNVGAILAFLVSFQMLFVSVYLFTNNKGKRKNNVLLGLIFLMFSMNLADFTIRVSGIILPVPFIHLVDDSFFFLYGPLLWGYVRSVAYKNFKLHWKLWPHLIPYLLFLWILIYQFGFVDHKSQEELVTQIASIQFPLWVILTSSIIYFHIFIYLWYSWKVLRKYQIEIKNQFSNIDQINLGWLRFIVRAFALITAIAMTQNLLPAIDNLTYFYISILLLLSFSFLFINRVLMKALNQPVIFSGIDEVEKYASSNLDQKQVTNYKTQLTRLMEDEEMYLNPELKSQDLADELQISSKILSQIVNQSFDKNFFDFVNSYRCEKVKEILGNESEKFTIIEAMYQSGFNSKSSFNKEFKKLTGQTPSEYRKSLKS